MSKQSLVSLSEIESQIYTIRNHKVMLDMDLAVLYDVETFNLNKAVKRNLKRFPIHFMFQLTKKEFEELKSQVSSLGLKFQFGISSWGGRRTLPYAF